MRYKYIGKTSYLLSYTYVLIYVIDDDLISPCRLNILSAARFQSAILNDVILFKMNHSKRNSICHVWNFRVWALFADGLAPWLVKIALKNKRSSIRQHCRHWWPCKLPLRQLKVPNWRSFQFQIWTGMGKITMVQHFMKCTGVHPDGYPRSIHVAIWWLNDTEPGSLPSSKGCHIGRSHC